jgi:hypothetical protein
MKTTVKLNGGMSLVVNPIDHAKNEFVGGVALQLNTHDGARIVMLTPDQCGALLFGFERAIEVIEARRMGAA